MVVNYWKTFSFTRAESIQSVFIITVCRFTLLSCSHHPQLFYSFDSVATGDPFQEYKRHQYCHAVPLKKKEFPITHTYEELSDETYFAIRKTMIRHIRALRKYDPESCF